MPSLCRLVVLVVRVGQSTHALAHGRRLGECETLRLPRRTRCCCCCRGWLSLKAPVRETLKRYSVRGVVTWRLSPTIAPSLHRGRIKRNSMKMSSRLADIAYSEELLGGSGATRLGQQIGLHPPPVPGGVTKPCLDDWCARGCEEQQVTVSRHPSASVC